jgi:outer membrane protein assembly factor BamB
VLTCLDAASGEVHYSERLGTGSEGFTSSPVSDGRNLFIASENGNVYVVPATTTFSVIATNQMNETCMATPLLSDGMLCYRTRGKLVALSDALSR